MLNYQDYKNYTNAVGEYVLWYLKKILFKLPSTVNFL